MTARRSASLAAALVYGDDSDDWVSRRVRQNLEGGRLPGQRSAWGDGEWDGHAHSRTSLPGAPLLARCTADTTLTIPTLLTIPARN